MLLVYGCELVSGTGVIESYRTAPKGSVALALIAGIELWRMIKKGQKKWRGNTSPAEQFYGLAA